MEIDPITKLPNWYAGGAVSPTWSPLDFIGGGGVGRTLKPVAAEAVGTARAARNPTRFPGRSVLYSVKVPARDITNSYTVWEKHVDAAGNTVRLNKTTISPNGDLVHIKEYELNNIKSTMKSMKSRALLLEALRRNEDPEKIENILRDLREYPWDAEKPFATLERQHIIAILRRYLIGELSEHDIEEWANAFEPRSDVAFGINDDDEDVRDAIYVLANPVLEGKLTQKMAQEIIGRLSNI